MNVAMRKQSLQSLGIDQDKPDLVIHLLSIIQGLFLQTSEMSVHLNEIK